MYIEYEFSALFTMHKNPLSRCFYFIRRIFPQRQFTIQFNDSRTISYARLRSAVKDDVKLCLYIFLI